MISKVLNGHSFKPACRYVLKKPEAKVLAAEGLRSRNADLMADDFIFQQQLRPAKKQACFHAVLSFHPTEKPDDSLMAEIARKYLEHIGMINTQYAIVKHSDKNHLHMHILANYVNQYGQAISDQWIGARAKKVAQQLTEEYGLIPATKKSLEWQHPENFYKSERERYHIYCAIHRALPKCHNMDELEKELAAKGVQTIYKYKGQSTEKQGVSFKLGDYSFKGSKVDRNFSLGKLEKYFARSHSHSMMPNGYQEKQAYSTEDNHTEITDSHNNNMPLVNIGKGKFAFSNGGAHEQSTHKKKKKRRRRS